MALRGTLKDFGIADIFQLISHQGKTGKLRVTNRGQTVQIHFRDGNIVRAESSSRQKKELLGHMLLRAEVINEAQLEAALAAQKSTGKRIGDMLIEQTGLEPKTLKSFTRIQTTETLYRLFLWDAGSYEFEQADVPAVDASELIRSENILMEGFRQADEWPILRKKIVSYGLVFERRQDLDKLETQASSANVPTDADLSLDDAFADLQNTEGSKNPLKNIGQNERIVYQLVRANYDVQKIIDLSRLGEFDTCKALATLLDAGIIATVSESSRPSAEAVVGGIHARAQVRWAPAVTRVLLTLGLLGGALVAGRSLGIQPPPWLKMQRTNMGFLDQSVEQLLSKSHLQRLQRALAVYHAENGKFPERLQDLVDSGLVSERELCFPWRSNYFYERDETSYQLLRPIY